MTTCPEQLAMGNVYFVQIGLLDGNRICSANGILAGMYLHMLLLQSSLVLQGFTKAFKHLSAWYQT